MSDKMAAPAGLPGLNHSSASALLLLLICGDFAFIFLHVVNVWAGIDLRLLDLSKDRGYPEMYQYLKFFWIMILLFRISLSRKIIGYLAWIPIFAYFLFDDALQIHERGGSFIASHIAFTPPFSLRVQDIGELTVSAIAGTFLFPVLVWAYWSGSQAFRKFSLDVVLLILLLLFFGVFVDMLHEALNLGATGYLLFGSLEDGGEMLSVSLILWRAFLSDVRPDDSGWHLVDGLKAAFATLKGRAA